MKEVKTLDKVSAAKKTRTPMSPLSKSTALKACLTAVFTALCFICTLLIGQKYPFGKYTTVMSDLEAQYAPYLFLLKAKLAGLNPERFVSDFGYSFLLGPGKNFMGTFGYYLGSPLNLLVLLFDPAGVNEFVILLMGLKLSLASSFMYLFIEERAKIKGSRWPVLWGIMYAFTSYTIIFLFHIMWLDGYMLLPLLLFMIERYLKNGRLQGVTAVLFFLFLSNYYIAYIAGIYSFIYLLSRMYLTGRFCKEGKPLLTIGRFILRAVLCALALCVILIPVGLDTLRNSDPTHSVYDPSYVGFNLMQFIDRIFLGYPGDFSDVLIANMPLIFVSLLVTLLCVVYLVSPAFKGREKRFYIAAFILIYISLCVDFIDVAWQVFDSPNWFWHREAFVFITFFLTVSYKVLENLKNVTKKDILKSAGILALLLLAAQSFGQMRDNGKVFLFNAVITAVLTLLLVGMKKTDWKGQLSNMGTLLPAFLAAFTVYEVVFLSSILSSGTATLSLHVGRADKYKDTIRTVEAFTEDSAGLNEGMRRETDALLSSEGIVVSGTSCYGNYRGLTIFNSNSNKKLGRFFKQLGYNINYNYFSVGHSYSAPSADAFFSVGALYSTDGDYKDADLIEYTDDGLYLYRTRTVLPAAFSVSPDAGDFDFYALETDTGDKNYFNFQNDWYRSLFDEFTEDFFVEVPDNMISYELINGSVIDFNDYMLPEDGGDDEDEEDKSEDIDPDDIGGEVYGDYDASKTTIYSANKSLPIILSYDVTADRTCELYLNISCPRMNNGCDVYINGRSAASYSAGSFYSAVIRLGSYDIGEKVRVSIVSYEDSWEYVSVNFAYFDMDVYASQFNAVSTDDVRINELDDGFVSLTAHETGESLILTSIPLEDGWELTVNGEKADIIPYEDALISFKVPSGDSRAELRFTPPGLFAGSALSVMGIAGLIAITIIDNRKKNWNNSDSKNNNTKGETSNERS